MREDRIKSLQKERNEVTRRIRRLDKQIEQSREALSLASAQVASFKETGRFMSN
jgi:uncharacterized protein involved in exopolysaccharide biosynthesis